MGGKHMRRVLMLAGLAGVTVAGLAAARPEHWISAGFDTALSRQQTAVSFATQKPAAGQVVQAAGPVGDETFWLDRVRDIGSAPFPAPVSVGDRITISSHAGAPRQLEVIGLRRIGSEVTPVGLTAGEAQLVLVTCRVVGSEPNQVVRFLVEARSAILPLAPSDKTHKAL